MITRSPLEPNKTIAKGDWQHIGLCTKSTLALTLSQIGYDELSICFCQNNQEAETLMEAVRFFNPNCNTTFFPDWEILPFDPFSPHEDIISTRLKTLSELPSLKRGVVFIPVNAAISRLLPKGYLDSQALHLSLGDHLDINEWQTTLTNAGYQRVGDVMAHGEFTIRGSILDIFPMGSQTPYRIDCFDNEIDSIRLFDPETQRSFEKIETTAVLPAHEYPLNEHAISFFRSQFRQHFDVNPKNCPIYNAVSNGEAASGLEFYLPLFYETTSCIFDYIPIDALLCYSQTLQQQLQHLFDDIQNRYDNLRYDVERPILSPDQLYLSPDQFNSELKTFRRLQWHSDKIEEKQNQKNFAISSINNIQVEHSHKHPIKPLEQFIQKFDGRILLMAESLGRQEILFDLLKPANLKIQECKSFSAFLSNDQALCITTSPVQSGFIDQDKKITLIGEADLFGEHVCSRRKKRKNQIDPAQMIHSLLELKIGEPVVHINHGIGSYQGLTHLDAGGVSAEYLILEYADKDKVYVPIDRLDVISRYITNNPDHATLNKLGSNRWSKQKAQALKRIRDVAAELLVIYSKREATPGFNFNKPSADFIQFRSAFPFDETPDQAQAIDSVIDDMTRNRAMDRLICGDVGFGKTEVAIQAAALALQSNKQVAVLVPTTLLVGQHTESFQNRFANWPVKISGLSRFNSPKEQESILNNLKDGKIDIIIGTHRLLSKDIKFNDLGLLIVDEEHRFGVRDKDKIKAMRANVDILTLTATPIPRTLNMAFSGIRDMSIIATAPEKRLSVKTFLKPRSDTLIKEAIAREVMRGGQVYFLHNSVETIHALKEKLEALMPDISIAIGHGQMPKRQLENVMLDFYHQRIQVLLATTIIESGIDVPTANTIIIDKANQFGLAQLHQLRGRVGRSHHQAYAYLLVPSIKGLNRDAKKRLEALTEVDSLGAGFHLANNDLEIRGAGELLGDEQSGHMQAIGFSLYMEMLDEAVKALKNGEEFKGLEREQELEIDLRVSALIPDTLIPDVNTRLNLYKRLADCQSLDDIDTIRIEMIDRFGKLPEPCLNLIGISQLRLQAKAMGITKIEMNKQLGHIFFNEKPKIRFDVVIELIQKHSKKYQLLGNSTLRIQAAHIEPAERITVLKELIEKISA